MSTHDVIYKCRLCGETFRSKTVPNDKVIQVAVELSHKDVSFPDDPPAMGVGLREAHHCADGACGMGYLLGLRPSST